MSVIRRLGDAARADRAFATAWLLLSAFTVAPIWVGRYLPLLDLPNHLSAIFVWHHYHDPRFDFWKYYTLNLQPLPYWFHYYSVHLLAYVTGVELGNKLFLTAYALGLPLGALAAARRFGRSPYLALFTFPLVWNFNFADGFIAYCAGVALLPVGLILVDRHAEQPTLARALGVFAFGTGLYFVHLLPYLMFLVCGAVVALLQPRPRAAPERILPVMASALIGTWAFRHAGQMRFHPLEGERLFSHRSLLANLVDTPTRLLDVLRSRNDEWVLVVLAGCWLMLAATAAVQRGSEPPRARSLRSYAVEACFAVLILAYFNLPLSMHRPFYWHMINGRVVVAAALLGALLVRGPVLAWRRWLFVPVVLAGIFYGWNLSRMVIRFNRHVRGFDELVETIPLHRRVLTLVLPPLNDPQVNVNCFNQWASYVQIRRGGYNFYNFDEGFPLRYREYLPAPPWSNADKFDYEQHGHAWDYFLTHNESDLKLLTGPAAKGQVRLVGESGPWRLWQNLARR